MSRLLPWAIALALVLLPVAVQRPYARLVHVEDDLDHLQHVADYFSGEKSLVRYLFTPVNEHLLPLWRGWYYVSWRLFGLEPTGWHVTVALIHGLSAAALFVVLRAYTGRLMASVFGAGLWAMAGFGGWDSPVCWIAASHLAFGVAWFLAAMACLTRYRNAGWRWPALMAACMTLAVLAMSAMWALLPALVAQWWLLERRPGEGWMPLRRWGAAWLATFAVLSPLAVLGGMQTFEANAQQFDHYPARAVIRTPATWTIAVENLCYRDTSWAPTAKIASRLAGRDVSPVAPRAVLGVLLMALPLAVPTVNRRLIILFMGTVLVYGLLVQYARSSFDDMYVLTQGRYAYLPTLGWCGVAAAVLAAPWFYATRLRTRVLGAVTVVASLGLAWQQVRVTHQTVEVFRRTTRDHRTDMELSRDFLEFLRAEARRQGRTIRVPNVSWACRPTNFSVKQFDIITAPDGPRALEIVSMRQWTPDDNANLETLLARTSNPIRWSVGDALSGFVDLAAVLASLDRNAAQSGPLRFPDSITTIPVAAYIGRGEPHPPRSADDADWAKLPVSQRLSVFAARLFPEGLSHLVFVRAENCTEEDRLATIAALAACREPLAEQWRKALEASP